MTTGNNQKDSKNNTRRIHSSRWYWLRQTCADGSGKGPAPPDGTQGQEFGRVTFSVR